MTTVVDLRNRLAKLDIGYEAETAIDNTKDTILVKQKDQLLHGTKADGSLIGHYKSKVYAAMKYALNPLAGFGNMDWKLTGSLYGGLFVDVRSDIFVIDSSDPKAGQLIQKHGDPFGLNTKNQTAYVEEKLRPEFMSRIHRATGL